MDVNRGRGRIMTVNKKQNHGCQQDRSRIITVNRDRGRIVAVNRGRGRIMAVNKDRGRIVAGGKQGQNCSCKQG